MAKCAHKWVFDYSGGYSKPDGRNSLMFYKSDHYHCEKCLEQIVKKEHYSCFDQEVWKAPEWVQVLVHGKFTQS